MSVHGRGTDEVAKRAQENANLIWNAANSLFGAFKPHEYGLVILPMCVIKRFHDCLLPKHDAVLAAYEQHKDKGARAAAFLRAASGYHFYNTSKFTFEKLKADPENIEDNFQDFLNGFSDDVQEILNRMNFAAQIERMKEAKCLYQIICDFSVEKLDMSEGKISTVDMGYIFENLVQRFSESYDEEAGAHFTSRDIIYLMCDLLTANDKKAEDDFHCTVYDMTMGTSQMLTCMTERIHENNSNADVQTFGQEINPFTMGIAVADTLIHGGDPDNMKFGDTLSDDQFEGYKFDYVISNPPFGIDWKREASEVEKEHKKGEEGRFAPGLPGKADGQMLFMLNGIAKLKDESGKMAIIQNASSLFTGDAGSGQSEIRRYILENNWLDAIVQLPNDSFYNTGIATYIWLIDKGRNLRGAEGVLLIDASRCCEMRKKPIGNKRMDIQDESRKLILEAYQGYKTDEYSCVLDSGKVLTCKSKLYTPIDFGYRKIVIESPLLDENGNAVLKKGKPVADVSRRDTENVPMSDDIDEYFKREVLKYNPDAWLDRTKTKDGYEIPFIKLFFEFKELEPVDEVLKRIEMNEEILMGKISDMFGREDK